jgi:O-antigen ligase
LVLSLVVFGLLVIWQPGVLIDSLVDPFNEARAGASEVRNEVYEANWIGFYKAPLFGHGWPGESVVENDPVFGDDAALIVVGSHSTISGLLYKGGLVTFSLFLFAFLCTVRGLLKQKDSALLKNNLMIALGIGFTCFGEGLEALVLPMLFAFLWIGASLRTTVPCGLHPEKPRVVR